MHFSGLIAPHVNHNAFNQQIEAEANNNVIQQASSPFASGQNNIFENELLQAIGVKYNKSVAQVILRWLTQREIVSFAKSVNKDELELQRGVEAYANR